MKCIVKECNEDAAEMHEIFFGKQIGRDRCIKYEVRVPVCRRHHNCSHGQRPGWKRCDFESLKKEDVQKYFCERLEIDFEKVKTALDHFSDDDQQYLTEIKLHILKVRSYE